MKGLLILRATLARVMGEGEPGNPNSGLYSLELSGRVGEHASTFAFPVFAVRRAIPGPGIGANCAAST